MRPLFRPATPTTSSNGPSFVLVIVIGVILLWVGSGRGCGVPGVALQPPAGPDLTKAFATNDNRREASQHAHVFATICGTLADFIEDDGKQTDPRIKTGVQIDDFRRLVRQTRTRGWSFLAKYPELGPALETHLSGQVGTGGGPIDAAQRTKWVAAMRQLQACAQYAAERG